MHNLKAWGNNYAESIFNFSVFQTFLVKLHLSTFSFNSVATHNAISYRCLLINGSWITAKVSSTSSNLSELSFERCFPEIIRNVINLLRDRWGLCHIPANKTWLVLQYFMGGRAQTNSHSRWRWIPNQIPWINIVTMFSNCCGDILHGNPISQSNKIHHFTPIHNSTMITIYYAGARLSHLNSSYYTIIKWKSQHNLIHSTLHKFDKFSISLCWGKNEKKLSQIYKKKS